jgi:hypothetical protein
MYIYNQKRISPIEFFLTQFKNRQIFINLFEHLRIIYYIQYLNFSLLKNWRIFYIVNITCFILKLYYYKLTQFVITEKYYHFTQKKMILGPLKYKWRKSRQNRHHYSVDSNINIVCSLFLIKIIDKLRIKLCLIKSLYSTLITQSPVCGPQLKISIIRTKYLIHKPYYFDFLLTVLLICNYALSTYFLILLTWHLQGHFKHKKHMWTILTIFKNFYFLKPQILGIKLLIKGPFDKHGRTRTFLKQIGVIKSFTNYNFQFVYDKISCIGIYGIFNIRFWILYI